ncbi:MAG: cobalamin-dependent protein [Kiritimatiellaeota bacterium]|nr:cobalamin-dependent protein [Kiritimatiellota bacterium]
MAKNEELFTAITKGQRKMVEEIVNKAVAGGASVVEMLNDSMIPAMRNMGDKFSRNEVYVPEMLIAARAMAAGLKIIEPILVSAGHKPLAKVCIGTVKGDLHDIGKNLVAMMLKGAGYEVDDLGVDCDVAKFQAAVDRGAQAVLCSALLTTTMPYMKTVTDALKGKNTKVVVGGAPVTQQYANEIGAAGYGADANDAVKVIDQLLGVRA